MKHFLAYIDKESYSVGLNSDGIVYVYIKDNVELTVALQQPMIDDYNSITGGVLHPFVFIPGTNCSITKEARENSVILEFKKPISASAVVVNNAVYKLVANFYYKFNRPSKPYKVFSNLEDALSWLKQFK